MVAPGYLTAGCAAGTTHPITGKGIRGAALSGYSAGRTAAGAVEDDDVSENRLWEHNYFLYVEHGEGAKLAARDAYNVAASSIDIPVLRAIAAVLPEDEIREIVSTETKFDDFTSKLNIVAGAMKNVVSHYRAGTFDHLGVSNGQLYEALVGFKQTREYVDEYEELYMNYPESRNRYDAWLAQRNHLDEEFYDALELDAKTESTDWVGFPSHSESIATQSSGWLTNPSTRSFVSLSFTAGVDPSVTDVFERVGRLICRASWDRERTHRVRRLQRYGRRWYGRTGRSSLDSCITED